MDNKDKIILDLCGGTGAWSKPYKEAEYDVRLITLPFYDIKKFVFTFPPEKVYGILAAPPCDQFSYAKTTGKPRNLKGGMEIVIACLNIVWECQYNLEHPFAKKTMLKFWALENPKGMLKLFLGKPAFEFNPCDFGDPYQKHTFLWGNFNPPQKQPVLPLFVQDYRGKKCWNIHEKTGGKSEKTKMLRSITPSGFAKAFFEANK